MRKTIGLATILTVILFAVSSAEWTGTTSEQTITYENLVDDSLEVRVATFCAAPDGDLYAVYAQTKSPSPYTRELYFSKSTDGGRTWSGTAGDVMINADDGQIVYQSSNYEYIDMQVDSQGRIFVVWTEDYERTGIREIMLVYSTDYGTTWENSTADVPVSNSTGIAYDAGKPAIAVDPNDNLHAVWHQKTDSTYNTYEICYSQSTDNGLTWTGQTADREISFRNGLSAWDPDVDCDGLGNIYVIWREDAYSGGQDRIFFGKSTDGGTTFSSETADLPISLEYQETGAAQIHVDAFNNINVVYKGSEPSPNLTKLSLYTGSTDGGATWSGNSGLIYVDSGPGPDLDTWGVDITSTSDGTLIAVYSQGPALHNNIWASYSTDLGATWSGSTNPDLVSYAGAVYNSHVPYIVTAPGDTLHVIWRQKAETATKEDLFYSRGDTLASGGSGCPHVVGDVNGSDNYNGLDITYGVAFFKGGSDPLCPDCPIGDCNTWHYCGDVNGSCNYNGLDITYGVAYFKGGADPIFCPDCPPIVGPASIGNEFRPTEQPAVESKSKSKKESSLKRQ
ncbi:MAG: exo-alpha-sialidase [Candidatus Zixiibacteriota bacterium]|nr:MAG: exo-alpha-sialidase [candidate division Zixibacteria bacterium]